MEFNIIIWHWDKKLFERKVQYDSQALADAFTMGLYHAFDSVGKKPTGMETRPVKPVKLVTACCRAEPQECIVNDDFSTECSECHNESPRLTPLS